MISLLAISVAALIGLLAGFALAWWLRHKTDISIRNVYLAAALLVLLEAALLAVGALVVAAVLLPACLLCASAAGVGRRWRLSDLGAGEELRDYENARRWLWQPARELQEGETVQIAGQGQVVRTLAWPESEPYVLMTTDPDGPRVPRGDGHHIFAVGGTGSGKTTSILRALAGRVIKTGGAALVIDQKGDVPTEDFLRRLAAAVGRPLVVFDPRSGYGSDRWQPIWGDEPNEVAARLVSGIQTSEVYYADALRNHLILVLSVLHAAGEWPPSVRDVIQATKLTRYKRILRLAKHLPETGPLDATERRMLIDDVIEHGEVLRTAKGKSDLSGGLMRLALVGRAWSKVLQPRELADGQLAAITLPQALDAGAIVLWRTWVDAMPDAAAAMTALALSDIHAAASVASTDATTGKAPAPPWTVLLDEVAGVMEQAAGLVLALLQRARSHHGQIHVVTQSVADVEALTGMRGMLESLTDNFAALIIHRQQAPDSRDWLARLLGTVSLWSSTDQTTGSGVVATGDGSRRRVRQFVVSSDTFAHLPKYQAIIASFLPAADPVQVRVAQLHLPDGEPIRIGGDAITPLETAIYTSDEVDKEGDGSDDAPEVPAARAITPARRPRRSLRAKPSEGPTEDLDEEPQRLDETEPAAATLDVVERPPEATEPPDGEALDEEPQRVAAATTRRTRKAKRPASGSTAARPDVTDAANPEATADEEPEWRPGSALDL